MDFIHPAGNSDALCILSCYQTLKAESKHILLLIWLKVRLQGGTEGLWISFCAYFEPELLSFPLALHLTAQRPTLSVLCYIVIYDGRE